MNSRNVYLTAALCLTSVILVSAWRVVSTKNIDAPSETTTDTETSTVCTETADPNCITDSPPSTTSEQTPLPTNTTLISSLDFDDDYKFLLGESIKFSDGLTVTLFNIADSRCPADAQCFWAGELAPQFKVTGGNFISQTFDLVFGTVRATTIKKSDYIFRLTTANKDTATIIVSHQTPDS